MALILLHGPPGCGKTSFCQALAGALKLDVCMLTLANKAEVPGSSGWPGWTVSG